MGPKGQEICAIHSADESGRRMSAETAKANAKLITATPELLEACKLALAGYREDKPGMYLTTVKKLKEVISKAEGTV